MCSLYIQWGALYSAGARYSAGEIAWHNMDPSIVRVPHYSGHPSIVRVWSLSRPSIVRVLTSPPFECGQTHTNSRRTHLSLPHNSSSVPIQSTRTGETYTMPYAAGELCLQHNHTPVDPHGHQCRGGCGGRLHGNCGDVEGESETLCHLHSPCCWL